MKTIQTPLLEIAFEDVGPRHGHPVVLLHGWPDVPRSWAAVAKRLNNGTYRLIIPYLRGFQPTRFLSDAMPRIGHAVALAQDAIDLADALRIKRFAVVGHDWGARAAYTLAALFPERVGSIAALSVPFEPRGQFTAPAFAQAARFWYQWFMCADAGVDAIGRDPVGFARYLWETWSPAGWLDEAEFAAAAAAFTGPDFLPVTLHAYRSRWLSGEPWSAPYRPLEEKLAAIEQLSTPTLQIRGDADRCDGADLFENAEGRFLGPYRLAVLPGVGHFPHRESPAAVAGLLHHHLAVYA